MKPGARDPASSPPSQEVPSLGRGGAGGFQAGLALGPPRQQTSAAELQSGQAWSGETGCLAATSPRPSQALGGTTWLLRAESSVWRWGQGTCPPHTRPVPVQPPVPPCPRPGLGVAASLSHQLVAAGSCERSLEGDAHSTHAGTHAARQAEGTQGPGRPRRGKPGRTGKRAGTVRERGAPSKTQRFDPWLGNSHAARKK